MAIVGVVALPSLEHRHAVHLLPFGALRVRTDHPQLGYMRQFGV